jgi:biopolymer transport protein ExbD
VRPAALLLLFLLASVAAGADVALPEASAAGPAPKGAVTVNLSDDGLISVESDGKPHVLSLGKLRAWLREKQTKLPAEKKGTGLSVVLRADTNAPWGHVQLILATCAAEGVRHVGFGVKGAEGEDGFLPADPPKEAETESGRTPVTIVVGVEAKREEIAVWGPQQTPILRPKDLVFRTGETETTDVADVRRYLRDAYQTAAAARPASIRGEVKAGAKIPFGVVVSVLNEYHRAGIPVGFASVPVPEEEDDTQRLPYPSR